MKVCEICGTAKGKISGKTGKFKIDLCRKHRGHMERHGEILERTKYDDNEFIINGDVLEIVMYNSKGIESGRALVDTKHKDIVVQYKWHINGHGYAINKTAGITLSLHRLVINASDGISVDHVNHCTLDNRECNLRICSHQENLMNQKIKSSNRSGYTGVHWRNRSKKWIARIMIDGKDIHLGCFVDINDAIAARKAAEIKYFGEFRNMEVSNDKN